MTKSTHNIFIKQEEISPGSFVLLDSFLDRTQGRVQSFYGGDGFKGVAHTPMEPAFCSRYGQALVMSKMKKELDKNVVKKYKIDKKINTVYF